VAGHVTDYNVVFFPSGLRGTFEAGTNLFEVAMKLGVDIATICGGARECGKCKIVVEEGLELLDDMASSESALISDDEKRDGVRLLCCIEMPEDGKLVLKVPESSRLGAQRLQTEGLELPEDFVIDPAIRKYHILLPRATLHDDRADQTRLLETFEAEYGIDLEIPYEVLTYLPLAMREVGGKKKDFDITVVVMDDNKVMAVEAGDTTDRCYGFAVDVGSTKLAGFLMDLNTGKVVGLASRMNPQIPYGEDVLSRITYAKKGMDNLKTVQAAVISGLNDMLDEVCDFTDIKHEEIYESVVVGNTAMHHLLLGVWPKFVTFAPYPAAVRKPSRAPSATLGLKMHPNASTYSLPIIRGFVGADQIAAELAVDFYNNDEMILELDIGTNTEMTLGNKDGCMCVSCASGPAFEGMMIRCGMRASNGAIEKIRIDPETREIEYDLIEGITSGAIRSCSKYRNVETKAIGVCGSGLCDVPAEFLKAAIILPSGQMNKELLGVDPSMRKGPRGLEYLIVPGEETAIGKDIVIEQADIRELTLAKGAMFCGAYLLMREMGQTVETVDKLVIAGAFGNFIDPESARIMGMFPEFPLDKIEGIGNAAGTGVRKALVSKAERAMANKFSEECKFVEAAIHPDYMKIYPESMYMPNKNLDLFPETAAMLRKLGRI